MKVLSFEMPLLATSKKEG